MTDSHANWDSAFLDTAVLGQAFINEDGEAVVAILKHAETDDLHRMLIVALDLVRRGLGDDGAGDFFEDLRKTSAEAEATGGNPKAPNLRDYIEDDGVDINLAADAAELVGLAIRGHDLDDRIERLLKVDHHGGLVAELAQIAAVLASRFGDDDWYTAERTAARAAKLP